MTEPDAGAARGGGSTSSTSTSTGTSTQTLPAVGGDTPAVPGRPRGAAGRARRFWATRRVPAAFVAAAVLAAAGALLYDVVAVRADRPAMAWRRRLADELATRQLDSLWVIAAAALVAAAGLWLVWLAVTPGLRSVLPMRPTATPGVRAGLDRRAAELVLRDSALQVAGVAAARVGVGRRKVKARVEVHFREVDEVREELDGVFADGLQRLGLSRPLTLNLTARPAEGR